MESVAQEVENQIGEANHNGHLDAEDYDDEGVHEYTDMDAHGFSTGSANGTDAEGGHDAEVAGISAGIRKASLATPSRSTEKLRTPTTCASPSAERVTPRKVASPSDQLTRTTKSRVNDLQELENQRRKKDGTKVKISPPNYQPSERLMRTTQSRIADIKEWEASRDRQNYDDDIWWELRRPHPQAVIKPDVQSKLMEFTTAFQQSMRQKKEKLPVTPTKDTHSVAKIDPTSPLLRTTINMQQHAWKTEPPRPPPIHLNLATTTSGPQVQSKITATTTATLNSQWKSKPSGDSSPDPSHLKHVKPPSERLLKYNTAMRNQSRGKVQKPPTDPREAGWNLIKISKETIPSVEVCFSARNVSRSRSHSPSRRSLSLSSSREGTIEAETIHAIDEAVAEYNEHLDLPPVTAVEEIRCPRPAKPRTRRPRRHRRMQRAVFKRGTKPYPVML